jgi:hypothetical protein
MEHIRQCSKEHTSSPFYVAEDVARLRPVTYLGAVLVLPFPDKLEKFVLVFLGANPGYLEEDPPQLSSIGGLGEIAAPDQSLSLDVNKAALHGDTRPEAPEHICQLRVAVNSEAEGTQSPLYQTLQEYPQLRCRAFGDGVLAGDKRMSLRIHQRNQTTRTMYKGSVQDEVLALLHDQYGLWRRLLKIVIDHTVKLPRAVPALTSQLPDRVALDDPTSEPFLFVGLSSPSIAPTERVPTPGTEPPLSAIGVMPISLDNTRTERTVFF